MDENTDLNLMCMCLQGVRSYYVNLDPAVMSVPFAANIDIRDTVDYKEVMGQYQLGPNGAIMTSLNLFATRFDQVRPSPNASEVHSRLPI
jgi:GTPase SAR1 family protein